MISYAKNYCQNMHNATAVTTGSANQRPNTPCIGLWIDVTFRVLEHSYMLSFSWTDNSLKVYVIFSCGMVYTICVNTNPKHVSLQKKQVMRFLVLYMHSSYVIYACCTQIIQWCLLNLVRIQYLLVYPQYWRGGFENNFMWSSNFSIHKWKQTVLLSSFIYAI